MKNNLNKFQKLLEEAPYGGIFLTSRTSRQYASGFRSSDGAVLITPDIGYLITDFRYIEAAGAADTGFEIIMNSRERKIHEIIGDLIKRHNIEVLAYENREMTCDEFSQYGEKIDVRFTPLGGRVEQLRAIKEYYEIESITRAQRISERAFDRLLPQIKEGMTERDVCALLVYLLLCEGADETAFETIVLSGPNTSLPHGSPGDRRLEKGDFVLLDFGAKVNGYCSDMTRTVALGSADEQMKKIYKIVLEANELGLRTARAGLHWQEAVDARVRSYIADEGYGDYFGHGLGHGVGIEIHERVDGNPDAPGVASAGAVVTVEPGIYLPSRFGVRIEDMVVLNNEGCENLTKCPKELLIL